MNMVAVIMAKYRINYVITNKMLTKYHTIILVKDNVMSFIDKARAWDLDLPSQWQGYQFRFWDGGGTCPTHVYPSLGGDTSPPIPESELITQPYGHCVDW